MAITTAAGSTGVIVNSAAKDSRLTESALGSQSGAAADQVIVPNAIGTNNEGNLASSPTYVGRLIMIRPSQRDEEVRFIVADSSNTLTVHEPWDTPPQSGDDWALSYIIQDVATVTGLSLLNKRVSDYGSNRRLSVGYHLGTGGNTDQFAWLAFVGGVSLETVDFSSSTVADFQVIRNGYLTNGYRSGGVGVSGGYVIGAPAVDGELAFDASDGAGSGVTLDLNDFFLTHVANATTKIQCGRHNDAKVFAGSNPLHLAGHDGSTPVAALGYTQFNSLTVEGRGTGAGEEVIVDHLIRTNGVVLIANNGFEHETTRSWEVRIAGPVWAGTSRLVGVNSNNRFKIINPTWSVDDLFQADIEFETTSNSPNVEEYYQLDVEVTQPDGTPLQDVTSYVSEFSLIEDVVNTGITTSDGQDTHYLLKRRFENRAAATSRGPITTPNGFDFVDGGSGNDQLVRNDGGSWISDGYELDGPVTVTGAETAANDGTYRILAVTASTIDVVTGSFTATTDDNSAVISAAASVNRNLRDGFSLKAYSYGRQAFVTPLSDLDGEGFPGPLDGVSISLPVDSNVSAGSIAAALSAPTTDPAYSRHGPGESDTNPLKVIAYDGGTGGLPTEGEVITIDNAGSDTTGNLVEIVGDAVSGTMVLENWNGVEPENNVTATGGTSSFSVTTDTTGGASSFNEEYTILVDCNDESLQVAYDYERAVMAKPGKLSDYHVPRQSNAKLLHRNAANEWYAVVLDKLGRLQVLKTTQDFGANLLDDVDWTPGADPFFVMDHYADGRALQDDGVPFGMWSELDGSTLHVMTVTLAGITSYHQFSTSTDTWSVQNEFVAQAWDFLHSATGNGTQPRHGLSNRSITSAGANVDTCQRVSFAVRSDGDVVAMVPARNKPNAASSLAWRIQYRVMTRESGVWTDRGEITSANDSSSGGNVQVFMDTSDVASCVWGEGNSGSDRILMRTIDGSNSLGSTHVIDAAASTITNNDELNRIGLGIIDGSDNIYCPFEDSTNDWSVATWASTTGSPTVTTRTGLNNNTMNRSSARTWPFVSACCVDDGTNIQLVYVDNNQDVLTEPNVDSAGSDTSLQSTDTARQVHADWDSDDSNIIYLEEYTPDSYADEGNPRSLKVRRGTSGMINGTLLDIRNLILDWGQGEHANLLKFGAGGYFTDRNVAQTEGVWVANRGAGTVDFFTSDSGALFTPPTSVTLTVTVKDENGAAIQSARVGIYSDPEGPAETELMNTLTNASGVATAAYNYTGDTAVEVRVRKGSPSSTKYVPVNSPQIITASGLDVTITLLVDAINAS